MLLSASILVLTPSVSTASLLVVSSAPLSSCMLPLALASLGPDSMSSRHARALAVLALFQCLRALLALYCHQVCPRACTDARRILVVLPVHSCAHFAAS
ncbi:hypothetical protein BKA82DRAFT_915985 [Pisolithus tinctorius]|uniref:Secreted protein n=1 Tax=Pisolithus tinctorius Marx 270 TaxID=870435 RepID=A0A0C3N800_PISTI|nr:hypothetical protein BKA82DRAFT_915985 [Pisolithus tinctorius]KIN97169.1 hypothetical protein M404DRAFT_915985 [Pisolithus tinctorius Marx 270]